MGQDFQIEIIAPDGLSALKSFLGTCPIELDLEVDESESVILRQNKCSQIAGFEFESRESDMLIFSMYVSHKSPQSAQSIILRFSEFLQSAVLPHKITEILHKVDFDEKWVSYQWPAHK